MKMKKLAAWILVFCLLLAGCQSTAIDQNVQGSPTDPAESLNDRFTMLNQQVRSKGKVEFREGGVQRIPYTGTVSDVQYITSVEQLPDYEVFEKYDAVFFRENALVLVTQSTGSGSIRLEIESLSVEGGEVKVKLKQSLDGDVGTADMAAWLVWAEVSAGLDLSWEMDTNAVGGAPARNPEPALQDK